MLIIEALDRFVNSDHKKPSDGSKILKFGYSFDSHLYRKQRHQTDQQVR